MMMKKLTAYMLTAAMAMSMLAGCGGAKGESAKEETAKTEQAEDIDNTDLVGEGLGRDYGVGPCGFDLDALVERIGKDKVSKLRIGVAVNQQVNDWQIDWADEFRKLGEEYGIDIQIISADEDSAKEVDNMKTFAAQGVDAIIIYPNNLDAVAASISEVNKTIPVINAVGDGSVQVDAAVEEFTPQELMGATIADQMAADANGEERYVMMTDHSADLFFLRARRDGFQARVDEKYPNIHVVDTRLDKADDGWLNQAKECMLANPEINAVFATYTLPMMGAYNAAQQLGIDEMYIYGIDANPATLELLAAGEINGLYIQFPRVHAYWSLFNALRVISGETFDPVQQDFPEWSPYAVYTATPDKAAEAKGILYPNK